MYKTIEARDSPPPLPHILDMYDIGKVINVNEY